MYIVHKKFLYVIIEAPQAKLHIHWYSFTLKTERDIIDKHNLNFSFKVQKQTLPGGKQILLKLISEGFNTYICGCCEYTLSSFLQPYINIITQ